MGKLSEDMANLPALAVLEAMGSGVIVQRQVGQTYQVCYMNPAARDMTQLSLDSAKIVDSVTPFIKLPAKMRCPVCLGTVQADVATPHVHGAILVTSSGDELKIKVKHSRIPLPNGEFLQLSLLDPFAEDMTLTQAHSDFVSTVSHEFRTPLTSIKGFADTMLRYGAQLPAEQQKRFVNIIKDQADRLSRLVENLLTVSKAGATRLEMTPRPLSLNRMVEKVIQNIKGKADCKRQFALHYPNPLPEVWADPDKFEQVMTNLIDNAVKYSYDESTVTITATVLEGNRLAIAIADQGVGIPPEHLPKIFTKFSRIDNPLTRLVEGTGLGLFITKSLTLAMQAEIEVTSEVGKGTTFTLIFPVATAEHLASVKLDAAAAWDDDDA
jgi:two-component system, OmpR family, phosphate regulon sensor histidine kinase PhoR